jgi:DNA-binding CsgD family transcriptional regulator
MVNEENPAAQPGSKHLPLSNKDLARLWRIPFPTDTELDNAGVALRERIKELNCLYGISQLAEQNPYSLDDLLQDLVNFLPYSWQYPEITAARIIFNNKTYASGNFRMTPWRQLSRIYMYHAAVGECCIVYLELQETNRQLTLERKALQESNIALRTLMARIEQEKQEIHHDIMMNVEKILMPILNALALQIPASQNKYVELLKTNLEEITSPFISQLSLAYQVMTPTEIAICNMIRNGISTKEIAEMRQISEATVNRHREKIRQKLKITNKKINLATFLQTSIQRGNNKVPACD